MAVCALVVALSVTYVIYDPDIWQHLLVGKVMWLTHSVPTRQIWTWPTYGQVDTTSSYSWGFRALLWPFWKFGGVLGLFTWRWLTTLAAFGLAWLVARRMGARGLSTLVVVVLGALVYRQRSQVRPETLVSVLLALELWVLETWRQGGSDRRAWLVAIAWAWANVHISYYIGLLVLGIYAVDAAIEDARARRARARTGDAGAPSGGRLRAFLWILPAAAAISFVNPFGWRALWQPFQYALYWKHEPIFQTIGELKPVSWEVNWKNGLPLLLVGWPLLCLWWWRRKGLDRVELVMLLYFAGTALSTQRFLGYLGLVCVPWMARDLDAWVRARRWPAWTTPPWSRAALAAVACVALSATELARPTMRLGVGFVWSRYPVKAADFMEAHDIRGHGFNAFFHGGYLLWRFWPDRTRLPFMDIHQAGTPRDRYDYAFARQDRTAWRSLERRHHFDYVLLNQPIAVQDSLLSFLDDDTTYTAVFQDDAAVVFVKRSGRYARLAEQYQFHVLPTSFKRTVALGEASTHDPVLRRALEADLRRVAAASPYHATAMSLLANIALFEGRLDEGRVLLEGAMRVDPNLGRGHERLAKIALATNHPEEAVRQFHLELELSQEPDAIALPMAMAYQQLGDRAAARRWYARVLKHDPGNAEVLDSLRTLDVARGR